MIYTHHWEYRPNNGSYEPGPFASYTICTACGVRTLRRDNPALPCPAGNQYSRQWLTTEGKIVSSEDMAVLQKAAPTYDPPPVRVIQGVLHGAAPPPATPLPAEAFGPPSDAPPAHKHPIDQIGVWQRATTSNDTRRTQTEALTKLLTKFLDEWADGPADQRARGGRIT